MMTDFETRVLARAEQIERRRILAKHGIAATAGKPKATASATAKWNAAVAAAKARCKDPMAAVVAANRENPGLRERMLAEVNEQPTAKRQAAPVASARERFQAAVEEAVAGGMTKARAVRHIVLTRPKLHASMIAEANGR